MEKDDVMQPKFCFSTSDPENREREKQKQKLLIKSLTYMLILGFKGCSVFNTMVSTEANNLLIKNIKCNTQRKSGSIIGSYLRSN